MIEKALRKLNHKHLLIVGGEAKQRQNLIDEIINKTNFPLFRFPKLMTKMESYTDFVKKENLYESWYTQKRKLNINQLLDFHREWIAENQSLVVLEEFQNMEQIWKLDIIKSYLEPLMYRKKGDKTIRLIISQENEDGLIENLSEEIRLNENEKRTSVQVTLDCIELIEVAYEMNIPFHQS